MKWNHLGHEVEVVINVDGKPINIGLHANDEERLVALSKPVETIVGLYLDDEKVVDMLKARAKNNAAA